MTSEVKLKRFCINYHVEVSEKELYCDLCAEIIEIDCMIEMGDERYLHE